MTRNNVFLFTADGLRYDRLSRSGYDVETSPTLDSLAETGSACEQTMVTGTGTRKSFPGILTSSYPLMYGGYAQLTDYRTTLARTFADYGYVTIGVNSNAQLHSRFGWDSGFDVYFDSEKTVSNGDISWFDVERDNSSQKSPADWFENLRSTAYKRLDQDGIVYRTLERGYRFVNTRDPPHPTADKIVDMTLEYVDRAPDDEPLFVFVHFMETHSPYIPPDEYRQAVDAPEISNRELWNINDRLHSNPQSLSGEEVSIISSMYDASLRYLDDELERLIDGLEERSLWDGSKMAFTSDHGEQFREHGGLTHCIEPYKEGTHVPLLFKLGDESLSNVTGVTSTIDIGPTLLDATIDNLTMPNRFHGQSLCPVLRGRESIPDDRTVFIQNANRSGREVNLDRRITGCRTKNWKFINSRDEQVETQLYHLPDDPKEHLNLAEADPQRVAEFEEIVADHYDQPAYTDYSLEGAIDTGDVGERLEALGYVDS